MGTRLRLGLVGQASDYALCKVSKSPLRARETTPSKIRATSKLPSWPRSRQLRQLRRLRQPSLLQKSVLRSSANSRSSSHLPSAWDGDGGSREGMHDRVGFSRISGLAWDVPGVCMHDAGCSCVWSQCSMGQWPSEAGQAFFVCARGRGAKDIWAYGKVIAARNKRRL